VTHTGRMSTPIAAYLAGLAGMGLKLDVHADPAVRENEAYFLAPDALELKPIGSGLRDSIVKLSTYATVPNELLEEYTTQPSDEDVARWRAEREARQAREDMRHAQLLAAGGVVAAVAGLHSPDGSRDCGGCDGGGDYPPSWPCRTWELLDEQVPR
jgi:hypothetical protein